MADEHTREYVIRKAGYFYRPKSQGYTGSVLEAGLYTLAQAISLTHPNGPNGPRDGLTYCLASEYPEIAKAANAAAELTRLRAENEALQKECNHWCSLANARQLRIDELLGETK